jgi:hypothetical protein
LILLLAVKFVSLVNSTEMVTDNFGKVIYYHIPEGDFNLNIFPLQNLKDVFILNGQKQKVTITRDTTYYIPFVQSYRVVGNVILNRDEYSSLGAISPSNVRIVATDSSGNSFPALSTFDGSFVLYVPQAGDYAVSINNVYGEKFVLQDPVYTVSFNGAKEFHVDFIFNEKKRSVNINGTSTSIDTLLGRKNTFIIAGADTLKNATLSIDSTIYSSASVKGKVKPQDLSIPVGPGILYRVQLRSSPFKIPPSKYSIRFKGVKNIFEYFENGNFKYTTQDLLTLPEAKKLKAELRAKEYLDAFLVPFYKGSRVRY